MYLRYRSSLILCCILTSCLAANIPKLAVVGGGIGGASAAYFLEELFGRNKIQIDVYEALKVGGRLSTCEVGGYEYEMGGAVIHPKNKYMIELAKLLELEQRKGVFQKFGLYNGESFVFSESSDWKLVNNLKVLWRYGLDTVKLQLFIDEMLEDFSRIYELQLKENAYSSVTELLLAMNKRFVRYLDISAKDGFKKDGFSDRVINELIMATLLVNYGQTPDVHKFVGAVSVAGGTSGLWAVHGGNKKVPEKLLKLTRCSLIDGRVLNVTLIPSTGKFVVGYNQNSVMSQEMYDIVILAVPLAKNMDNIKFVNFPYEFSFPGEYHQTVCTLVSGKLNTSYFSFESDDDHIDDILSVNNSLFFSSIGKVYPVDYKGEHGSQQSVWKIFSHDPLTSEQLSDLFTNIEEVKSIDWLAYPHYSSKIRSDKFILFDHLYHINAIEWAASAMEMSVIGAKNVALLAYNNWIRQTDGIFPRSMKDEL